MGKIIFIVPSLRMGGAERVIAGLFKECKKEYSTMMVIFHGPIEYNITGKVINLETPVGNIFKKISNNVLRIYKLRAIFKKYNPDIIISFLGNVQPIFTFYPLIVSIRSNPHLFNIWNQILCKIIYRMNNIQKIVVPSYKLKKILIKDFRINKNIHVIGNPLEFKNIDQLKKEKIQIKEKYILAVGRLSQEKRFDILIRSYKQSGIYRGIKLIIIGEGEKRDELQKLINSHGLENYISLRGLTNNPYKYMYNSKFLVLSSEFEGFPNVIQEALACGIPVISTDCKTGPSEIIKDKYNGLLIPTNDIEAMSIAIKELFVNTKLYNILKSNARKSVQNNDIKKIAEKWENIFPLNNS